MNRRSYFQSEDEDRFIAGVYNWCDRWCEQCRFNMRCRVHHAEQQRTADHLLRDEDPHDMDVVMSDVADSLREAAEMLQEMAERDGLVLDEIDVEEWYAEDEDDDGRLDLGRRAHADFRQDSLYVRADGWLNRVAALIDRVRDEMPAAGEEIASKVMREAREGIEPDEQAILSGLQGVRDAYDVLCFYRYFILVKLLRAMSSYAASERESPILAETSRFDALATIKTLRECTGRMTEALWRIAEFRRDWLDDAMPLANESEAIGREMEERFPGNADVVRPGFDTEPE